MPCMLVPVLLHVSRPSFASSIWGLDCVIVVIRIDPGREEEEGRGGEDAHVLGENRRGGRRGQVVHVGGEEGERGPGQARPRGALASAAEKGGCLTRFRALPRVVVARRRIWKVNVIISC